MTVRWALALASSLLWSAALTAEAPGEIAHTAYIRFHENPERGNEEVQTAAYIRAKIGQVPGVQVVPLPSVPTAVIALLDTGRPGPTIALRADMDARKADEPASHSPRSRVAGLMHNCGHDAHSAMLLGAIAGIAGDPGKYRGKIVFLFQPAEEIKGGADDIVASGILGKLGVQAIFAQHAASNLAVGQMSLGSGTPMAGSTTFTLKLTGKAIHAAIPYDGSDLAVVAARFVEDLAALPARAWDIANRPAVISVTRINTPPGEINSTPGEVTIEGTIRAFEALDTVAPGSTPIGTIIRERVAALATAYKVRADLALKQGAPRMINDERLERALLTGLQSAGVNVTLTRDRGMFAEDFAFYTETIPALYFGLGIAKDGLGAAPPHTVEFTIHPASLDVGVTFLTKLAEVATAQLPASPK